MRISSLVLFITSSMVLIGSLMSLMGHVCPRDYINFQNFQKRDTPDLQLHQLHIPVAHGEPLISGLSGAPLGVVSAIQ